MAHYHLSIKPMARIYKKRGGKMRSAVRSAAYRAREKLTDERGRKTWDYSYKEDLELSEIVGPDEMPAWMRDRGRLWNGVEAAEKRVDAQFAREVEIALPRELQPDQRADLVRKFVRDQFVSKGMVADINIHCPSASDGGAQPHAHIMLTLRKIDGDGFDSKKAREWNDKKLAKHWRAEWARYQNAALTVVKSDARVDHRSLSDQRSAALREGRTADAARLKRTPGVHLGPKYVAMIRRGIGLTAARIQRWRNSLGGDVHRLKALQRDMQQTRSLSALERIKAAPTPRPGLPASRPRVRGPVPR